MRYRILLLSILASVGIGASPIFAQALLPHTTKIKVGNLEEQAIRLAEDAANYAKFQQYDSALSFARFAAKLSPKSVQTQTVLGIIYRDIEQYDNAIVALNKANELSKNIPIILYNLGDTYLRNKNYPEAISNFKKVLTVEPKASPAMFGLGNAYFLSKRYDDAVTVYNEALAINEDFWQVTNNIGLVEYERGNIEKAIINWQKSLKQAEKAEISLSVEPTLALSAALFRKGDRDKAVQLAVQALKIDPRYGQVSYLVENLWGDRLVADVKAVLSQPQVKQILDESDLSIRKVPKLRRS